MLFRMVYFLALSSGWGNAGELYAPLESDQWVVRAYFFNEDMVRKLSLERSPWEINREGGFLILDVDLEGMALLDDLGFHWEVDDAMTLALRVPHELLDGQDSGIPGFPCYPTVEETFAIAQGLVATAPDLAQWLDVGDSWEKTLDPDGGYDLMVLKLTNQKKPGPKPVLFVMSAIHAREYATAPLNTRFAQYLVEQYGKNADATMLLDDHEIHLLLQSNPDGRKRAESGLFWRKNTDNDFCTGSNSRGVDLNRNFQFQWGCCGSSTNPCSEVFRGPDGGSEPEVAAIQEYVRSIFPDQKGDDINDPAPADATGVFIDIHSFSELVIWSYGFTPNPAPNSQGLTTLGRKMAFFNGYFPEPISQLANAGGSTADFAYGELGVAAFGFELGTNFFQDCNTFENQILPDNLPALVYAARVSRTPYLTTAGPETLAPELKITGNQFTLTAQFNDTRFSSRNGIEPVQNITDGQLYIDIPPWGANPHPIGMNPLDGSWDSAVEMGRVAVDTAGLEPGRHMVYVRGRDGSGQWGPVSAVFLDLVRFSDLMAAWPNNVTILDLLQAL